MSSYIYIFLFCPIHLPPKGRSLLRHFDKESVEEAGKIDGTLTKQNIKIDVVDSLIAGIAKVNNKKVLTRNIKHFEKTDAKIESY